MREGVVRQPGGPVGDNEDAPLWMRIVMSSAQGYADFYMYLTKIIHNCNDVIADCVDRGDIDNARKMAGKREALTELRFILEAYRKEGEENAR